MSSETGSVIIIGKQNFVKMQYFNDELTEIDFQNVQTCHKDK